MTGIYKTTEDLDLLDKETDGVIEVPEGDIIYILKHYQNGTCLIGYQGQLTIQYWYTLEDKIEEVK